MVWVCGESISKVNGESLSGSLVKVLIKKVWCVAFDFKVARLVLVWRGCIVWKERLVGWKVARLSCCFWSCCAIFFKVSACVRCSSGCVVENSSRGGGGSETWSSEWRSALPAI